MAGKKTALQKPQVQDPLERAMKLCDALGLAYAEKEAADETRKALSDELTALAEKHPELMDGMKSFKHGGVEVRSVSKTAAVIGDETRYNGAALHGRYPLLFKVAFSDAKIAQAMEQDEIRIVLEGYGIGLETSHKITVGKAK